MIVTVAFEVNNHVNVMESWPIKIDNMTFFLEREDSSLKKVCLSFSGVSTEHAPSITQTSDEKFSAIIKTKGDDYAASARKHIMNWQSVISGIQIVDLDYDSYEMRFHPENNEEEARIQLKSFRSSYDQALDSTCDFEQLGRAFCVETISDERIESTSHYREGRIAFEAGRYIDAYNNMFLFLETRYCDGKTKTVQQVDLLSKQPQLCRIIEENISTGAFSKEASKREKFDLFHPEDSILDKIKSLVHLRGKLRHHSLKSPLRWDPNKQDEYKGAARFLSLVVHDIVAKESIGDIYAPAALEKFRELSVSMGFETKIRLTTQRLNNDKEIALDVSYPTTVVSSRLCLAAFRNGIEACEKNKQLADTVRFEAIHTRSGLELFSLEFGVWAYTETRSAEFKHTIESIRCSFEHFRNEMIMRSEFFIPFHDQKFIILDVWNLLRRSFDHVERKDPTTRILNLKLFPNGSTKAIVAYRVGAQVKN